VAGRYRRQAEASGFQVGLIDLDVHEMPRRGLAMAIAEFVRPGRTAGEVRRGERVGIAGQERVNPGPRCGRQVALGVTTHPDELSNLGRRKMIEPSTMPLRHGDTDLPDDPKSSLTNSTALIVSAFLKNNHLQIADLPSILATVHSALAATAGPPPVAPQEPAANLRRLVIAGAIVCVECGKRFKSIKRHLASAHNLTPSAYRAKWRLKSDHPMVASDYAAARSSLAKSIGLGRKPAAPPIEAKARVQATASDAKPAAAKTAAKARAARKAKSIPKS
jgi:predicted transcriptional regulator